jgi:predicted CoA-substrate-specific enzyme activase
LGAEASTWQAWQELVREAAMIVAGVDIGSVATKAVVLTDGKVVGEAVARTGVSPARAGAEVLEAALARGRLSRGEVERIITTGYGRRSVGLGDGVVTEITAAGWGAWHLGAPWGCARTVVDLGGQDSKVVILDGSGAVADFAMNDKCAAGTGRFIEVMAGVLGVSLDEMGALSLQSADPVAINATCTVFAETEVISLIAQGRPVADIAAGIHRSIATRLAAMVRQLGGGDIFFCGGGARNEGVQAALKDTLGTKLYVPPAPQFVVALGAALVAADQLAHRAG